MEFLLIFFLFFIGIPITVLIHEIGHAIGLLVCTKNIIAKVYLGHPNTFTAPSYTMGRLHLYISMSNFGYCAYNGSSQNESQMTPLKRVVFTTGGPLMSLIFSLTLFIIFLFLNLSPYANFIITWFAISNLIQFIWTIIPIKYPKWMGGYSGMPSDGYKLVKLLRPKYS